MKRVKIIEVEYWFDGVTSSYQVTKEEFYNSYLEPLPKFLLLVFEDGTSKVINK